MKILSIETSCDETAVAVLDISGALESPDIKVLGNTLYSQAHLHEEFGGVYPNLARREHEKNLPTILERSLRESGLGVLDMDFIAVTEGPGLEPALWTGITFAQRLGEEWGKPVVGVNHMRGHIYSVLYSPDTSSEKRELRFPLLALLVSGGHTELVRMDKIGQYQILGRTRDDAVGEAFDKVARLLNLPYPGGPKVSALAEEDRKVNKEATIDLPRPMMHSGDLDFSYSGLKTAVLYKTKGVNLDEVERRAMARSFEDAAIDVLISKTKQAIDTSEVDINTLVVAGGVSANKHLVSEVERLKESYPQLDILIPDQKLTGDNAIMIGIASFIKVSLDPQVLENKEEIKANGNLRITSSEA